MDGRTFIVLCVLLRNTGRLKTNGLVSIEEQVCMFLHILGHHVKNRTIQSRFYRFRETISRYFNSVLCAVFQLHNHLLVSPDPVPENCSDERWKWFKDAIEKSNDTLDKFCQVLAKNKMTENQVIANDLQKMQLPLSDQVLVMQKFMQKPEVAEIFKAQQSEEQKLQFVASLLSGVFDD
ncbi:hypothetical protein Dsin_018521 [Dipteronia sinensis]|uniref:DUF8040 domain-containing protein n=1 Tax=Dipteronia sinensis TaxID=43782 RepID=A0AAE0E1V7_9ROSI|nr:hypothetical protein Dsin_018521 [Dipteronia sinensis]